MGKLKDTYEGRITWSFSGDGLPYGASTSLEFKRSEDWFAEGWWTNFKPVLRDAARDMHQLIASSPCVLDTVEVKLGPEETGPSFGIPLAMPGATGAESCPPSVSMLIKKRVPLISGRYAGRMFYPGISEGNVSSAGTIPTPALGPYQTAVDNFFEAITGLEDYGVICYVLSDGGDVADRYVDQLDVQLKVATQRRRLRR